MVCKGGTSTKVDLCCINISGVVVRRKYVSLSVGEKGCDVLLV